MEQSIWDMTHYRIRDLAQFGEESEDPLGVLVSNPENKNWAIAIDSMDEVIPPIPPDPKYVGKRIGMDRIVVLGPQGKVPAVNMPSCISGCSGVETVTQLPDYGTIDKVYRLENENEPDKFYRWVEDVSAESPSPKTGSFVPIVCNYEMKSGKGTTISDSPDSGYTRQVDLNITAPSSPEANVLSSEVATGLSHTKSGVGDSGAVFPSGQITTGSNFGDSVYVQNVTCNATGHVTALTETAVTYPSTAALVTTPGLVEIAMPDSVQDSPARSHIQPITGAEHSSPGTITPPAGEYVYLAPADHVHSAATLTFANLRDSTGAVDIEYNMAHDVTFNMKDVLHILPPTSIPASDMVLVSTMTAGGTAIWDDFSMTTRTCNSNGHSFVVVGTNTSLITNQSSPFQVIENTIYSVTATIQVKITEGLGLNNPANVPKCYVCIIDIGGVTRKFNIPGSYTFSLPYTLNVNCLYKAGASSTSDHMVNVDVKATLDDNIFSACCVEAKAVELI